MPKHRITITVDGLAASGKTALARRLAEKLGCAHLNSGLLYRGVALLAVESAANLTDEPELVKMVLDHQISLDLNKECSTELSIDGIVRSPNELNAHEISRAASIVAQYPNVRAQLLSAQREAFPGYDLVAEGRDMGTIVFPEAPVKFFVEARLGVRAERRFRQMCERGESQSLEQVQEEINARDQLDAERAVAPTKPAAGAVIIDNSDTPLDETVAMMVGHVEMARSGR